MKAFQQRVIEEKESLDKKIAKLDKFIHGNNDISINELDKLVTQSLLMQSYSDVLGERIDEFK